MAASIQHFWQAGCLTCSGMPIVACLSGMPLLPQCLFRPVTDLVGMHGSQFSLSSIWLSAGIAGTNQPCLSMDEADSGELPPPTAPPPEPCPAMADSGESMPPQELTEALPSSPATLAAPADDEELPPPPPPSSSPADPDAKLAALADDEELPPPPPPSSNLSDPDAKLAALADDEELPPPPLPSGSPSDQLAAQAEAQAKHLAQQMAALPAEEQVRRMAAALVLSDQSSKDLAKLNLSGRSLSIKFIFQQQQAQAKAARTPPGSPAVNPDFSTPPSRAAKHAGSDGDCLALVPVDLSPNGDPSCQALVPADSAHSPLTSLLRSASESDLAVSPVPEKPLAHNVKAVLLGSPAAMQALTAGETTGGLRGRQGRWKPGPGRPRKAVDLSGSIDPVAGSWGGRRRVLTGRKLRVDLTVEQKMAIIETLTARIQERQESRKTAFRGLAAVYGCREPTVRKVWDSRQEIKSRIAAWQDTGRSKYGLTGKPRGRPSAKAAGKRSSAHRTPGSRGYLGPPDLCRAERQAVARWARMEEENGHVLTRADLFRQFKMLVTVKHNELAARQDDDTDEGLTDEEKKILAFCSGRLKAWERPDLKEIAARKLLRQTGFRERSTNVLLQLSDSEVETRLRQAWRFWDWIVWLVAYGSTEQLADYVADPHVFDQHRRQTVVVCTDQVPVWLKVDAAFRIYSDKKMGALAKAQGYRRLLRRCQADEAAPGIVSAPSIVSDEGMSVRQIHSWLLRLSISGRQDDSFVLACLSSHLCLVCRSSPNVCSGQSLQSLTLSECMAASCFACFVWRYIGRGSP